MRKEEANDGDDLYPSFQEQSIEAEEKRGEGEKETTARYETSPHVDISVGVIHFSRLFALRKFEICVS